MKKTITMALMIVAFTFTVANAQDGKSRRASFGVQLGGNLNKVNGKDVLGDNFNNKFVPGFQAGINLEIPFTNSFCFQPGVQFITKNVKRTESDGSITLNMSFVEMPLDFIIKPQVGSGRILIGFGANVAYGLFGNWKTDVKGSNTLDQSGKIKFVNTYDRLAENPDNDQYIRPLDISIDFSFGYQFSNNFYLQAKGQYGLVNLAPEVENQRTGWGRGMVKTITTGLSVGYRF